MGEPGVGGVIEAAERRVGVAGKGGAGAARKEEGVGGRVRDDARDGRGGSALGRWPR